MAEPYETSGKDWSKVLLRSDEWHRTLSGEMAVWILARVAVLVACIAPLGLALWTANWSSVDSDDPPRPKEYVAWSDRVFLDKPIATGWLGARGIEYREWARKHPEAAAKVQRSEIK
jgi:hypothetical protein